MPHILLSPVLKWGLAALGAGVAIQWVVAEVRRVNEELDARRSRVRLRENRPTLRRDPITGEWRA
jgi:hypothetical protein